MVKSCAAYNCTNRATRGTNLSFHKFPLRDLNTLSEWLVKIGRDTFTPTYHSVLCSQHFEKECFWKNGNKKILKPSAVPTIFRFPGNIPKTSSVPSGICKLSEESIEPFEKVFIKEEKLSDDESTYVSEPLHAEQEIKLEFQESLNAISLAPKVNRCKKTTETHSVVDDGDKQKSSTGHKVKSGGKPKLNCNADALKDKNTPSSERPFFCSICEKTFSKSHHLTAHRRIHSGERPFACNVCEKTFTESGNLKRHQRTHLNKRAFHCDVCGSKFTEARDLTIHQRIHSGERPFVCSDCGKTFTQCGGLKTHQRIHSGERPFTCTICSRAFTVSSHLKRHQKVHTGE